MRILAVIFGILLLLPGLCCVGFGLMFTFNGYGMTPIGLVETGVGALITWGAVLLIINYAR